MSKVFSAADPSHSELGKNHQQVLNGGFLKSIIIWISFLKFLDSTNPNLNPMTNFDLKETWKPGDDAYLIYS